MIDKPHDQNDPNTRNVSSSNLIADERGILVRGWIDENGILRADGTPTNQDARPGDATREQVELAQDFAAAEAANAES